MYLCNTGMITYMDGIYIGGGKNSQQSNEKNT